MNQSRVVPLLLVFFASAVCFQAAGAVLDNFDEYVQGSGNTLYIQGANSLATAQQGTNGKWLRYGSAVSDGLYSSSGAGNPGRGAVADATFGTSKTLYLPEFFLTTAQNISISGTGSIGLDIKVTSTLLPNTMVAIEVQDAGGTQYLSAAQSLASDSTFQTFTFAFTPGSVTESLIGTPNDSLATVLSAVTEINLVFSNTVDTGSTIINFDNLTYLTAIPEPSVGMLLLDLLAGAGFLRVVQRFISRDSGY